MKSFKQIRESSVKSAERKPEKVVGADGKPKIRMVPVDREIVKEEDLDEISLQQLSKTIAKSGSGKNVSKAIGKDKIKKDLEAMRARMATNEATDDDYHKTLGPTKNSHEGIAALKKKHGMSHEKATATLKRLMGESADEVDEEKDPEEYDQEGDMMKGQLRQICSANEKLMSMVKDDDNLPEWVQSKVTKATDYIRSVRDYLESEQMDEKTLTPAEKKKREDIAKAMERDNPDMPMAKKMAIATATAKRVAEATDDDYHKTLGPTKNSDEGIAALKKKHGMSHTKAVATLKRLMGESVEEAVGTSAKYAGKSGMFGNKYTSKDHMLGMKNFSQVRKKRQDQRDSEHKQQDPKMAKMGYAKHMMDTDKADAKARKRGIDPTGKYDKYKKRNNVKEEVELDESITKMSHSRLKFHATKGVPHGSYSNAEIKDEHKRRMQVEPDYHKAKPSLSETADVEESMSNNMRLISKIKKSGVVKSGSMSKDPAPKNEEKDTHVTKDGRTAKKGLWYNIHQKRKRGEKPNPKGHPDRPSMDDMKKSQK